MKYVKWICLFLCLTRMGETHPLSTYRQQLGSIVQAERFAKERGEELRGLLIHKKKGNFASIQNPQGPFSITHPNTPNAHKIRSSVLLKTLMEGAKALGHEDTYGLREGFDPSNTISEVDELRKNRIDNFISTHIASKFPDTVKEFSRISLRNSLEKPKRDMAIDEVTKNRISLITQYIEKYYPDIFTHLGKIINVDFVDGHVMRLHFSGIKDKNPSSTQALIKMSLSMLMTYRTGNDVYFLQVLSRFVNYVDQNKEDRDCSFINQDVSSAFRGAVQVHQALRLLKTWDIDFLIDLFLQFRGKDIPLPVEVSTPDSKERWDPKSRPSIRALILQGVPNGTQKEIPEAIKPALEDLQYYQLLQSQLTDLEEYLKSYDRRKKANEMVIKEITGDKK